MNGTLLIALDVLAVAALLVAAAVVVVTARRRLLMRAGGTVDVSLRATPGPDGGGWVAGIGRYSGDQLRWYRTLSVAARPHTVLSRQELQVRGRRRPSGSEQLLLPPEAVVLECSYTDGPLELAMSEPASTGFLAWLEAAPPGRYHAR